MQRARRRSTSVRQWLNIICLWVFVLYLFWDLFASFHAEAQQRWPDLDSPLLQVLDALYPLPRVVHHLGEEVGEAGSAELGGPSPVQWAVVDGLSVGRVAQAGQLLAGAAAAALIWRCVGHISRRKAVIFANRRISLLSDWVCVS